MQTLCRYVYLHTVMNNHIIENKYNFFELALTKISILTDFAMHFIFLLIIIRFTHQVSSLITDGIQFNVALVCPNEQTLCGNTLEMWRLYNSFYVCSISFYLFISSPFYEWKRLSYVLVPNRYTTLTLNIRNPT